MWAWLKGGVISTKAKRVEKSVEKAKTLRKYAPKAERQQQGALAEEIAHKHLLHQGLKSIDANVACTQGEIDLIMLDGQTLVFVEVRWRKNIAFGGAIASITPHKISKLSKACEIFLQHEPQWRAYPCRIDVVALQGSLDAAAIEWLQNVTG